LDEGLNDVVFGDNCGCQTPLNPAWDIIQGDTATFDYYDTVQAEEFTEFNDPVRRLEIDIPTEGVVFSAVKLTIFNDNQGATEAQFTPIIDLLTFFEAGTVDSANSSDTVPVSNWEEVTIPIPGTQVDTLRVSILVYQATDAAFNGAVYLREVCLVE